MSHGFFTIEQWKQSKWVVVCHLSGGKVSDAIKTLEKNGKPGFFRVIQTQRMIWAEKANGKLKLRKWHANSHETLQRSAEAFVRDRGKWPAKKS